MGHVREMVGERSDRLIAGIDLLAEASGLLLLGKPPAETLQAIVALCADRLGCYAAIYLRSGGASAVVAAGRPEHVAALRALPAESVAQTAASCDLAHAHFESMVEGGRSLGTLLLAVSNSSDLDNVAQKIARTVATIASAAVVRAESNAAQQRIVDRLQRALLPTRLPTVDGLVFDAAYRPATHESEVGGDWYDAFDLGNGRIGVSVGDVAGHGLDAAVAMGEARRAIRMAAAAIDSPCALLNYANNVLPLEDGVGMATAIAGFYNVATHTFTYACAGHPPPIAAIDGRAHLLPGGGLPLGLGPDIASPDWTITLSPDSSLYFYTDGLLEYDRDIIAGERRLALEIERTAATKPENAAIALHDAIFDGIDNTDDAATLVMRATQPRGDRMAAVYSAVPQFAKISRSALREIVKSRGIDQAIAEAISYATGEAVANAIEHGSNNSGETFGIDVELDGDRLHVVVENSGHWKTFVPRNERGRGMPIMQSLATDVRVTSTRNATRVHLTFALT